MNKSKSRIQPERCCCKSSFRFKDSIEVIQDCIQPGLLAAATPDNCDSASIERAPMPGNTGEIILKEKSADHATLTNTPQRLAIPANVQYPSFRLDPAQTYILQ